MGDPETHGDSIRAQDVIFQAKDYKISSLKQAL